MLSMTLLTQESADVDNMAAGIVLEDLLGAHMQFGFEFFGFVLPLRGTQKRGVVPQGRDEIWARASLIDLNRMFEQWFRFPLSAGRRIQFGQLPERGCPYHTFFVAGLLKTLPRSLKCCLRSSKIALPHSKFPD